MDCGFGITLLAFVISVTLGKTFYFTIPFLCWEYPVLGKYKYKILKIRGNKT